MIGANYSTFDGLDMLKSSILSIRSVVDKVVVVHQKIDFYGNQEEKNNADILNELVSLKLIDKLILVDVSRFIKEEGMIHKRNLGLNYLLSVGMEYVMTMDADEFYFDSEVSTVVSLMKTHQIDTCYSKIVTYYGDQYHCYDDVYYVPSIYSVVPSKRYGKYHSSVVCDQLRKMEENKSIIIDDFKMHHLSYVRSNLYEKYRSSLARGSTKINTNMRIVSEHFSKWSNNLPAVVFDTSGDLITVPLKPSTKKWLVG